AAIGGSRSNTAKGRGGQAETTPILPRASPASLTRCASRISSNRNTRDGLPLKAPAPPPAALVSTRAAHSRKPRLPRTKLPKKVMLPTRSSTAPRPLVTSLWICRASHRLADGTLSIAASPLGGSSDHGHDQDTARDTAPALAPPRACAPVAAPAAGV